jgi:hypothetical protein
MHINGHSAAPSDEVRWQEAKRVRYDRDILTALLREQVPVLDFVQWSVMDIEQGSVRTLLPLISPSTN